MLAESLPGGPAVLTVGLRSAGNALLPPVAGSAASVPRLSPVGLSAPS